MSSKNITKTSLCKDTFVVTFSERSEESFWRYEQNALSTNVKESFKKIDPEADKFQNVTSSSSDQHLPVCKVCWRLLFTKLCAVQCEQTSKIDYWLRLKRAKSIIDRDSKFRASDVIIHEELVQQPNGVENVNSSKKCLNWQCWIFKLWSWLTYYLYSKFRTKLMRSFREQCRRVCRSLLNSELSTARTDTCLWQTLTRRINGLTYLRQTDKRNWPTWDFS